MPTPVLPMGPAVLAMRKLEDAPTLATNAAALFDSSLRAALDRPEKVARPQNTADSDPRHEAPAPPKRASSDQADRANRAMKSKSRDGETQDRIDRDKAERDKAAAATRDAKPKVEKERKDEAHDDDSPSAEDGKARDDSPQQNASPEPKQREVLDVPKLPDAHLAALAGMVPTQVHSLEGIMERLSMQGIELDLPNRGQAQAMGQGLFGPQDFGANGKQAGQAKLNAEAPAQVLEAFHREMAELTSLGSSETVATTMPTGDSLSAQTSGDKSRGERQGTPRVGDTAKASIQSPKLEVQASPVSPVVDDETKVETDKSNAEALRTAMDASGKAVSHGAQKAGLQAQGTLRNQDLQGQASHSEAERAPDGNSASSAQRGLGEVTAQASAPAAKRAAPEATSVAEIKAPAGGEGRSTESTATSTSGAKSAPEVAKMAAPEKANQAARAEHVTKVLREVEMAVDRGGNAGDVKVNTQDGWVKVRVEVQGSEVRLAFSTENTSMRDALQSGMGELKTSLEQRGMHMGDPSFSNAAGDGQTSSDRQRDPSQREATRGDFSAVFDDAMRFGLSPSGFSLPTQPTPELAHEGKLHVRA